MTSNEAGKLAEDYHHCHCFLIDDERRAFSGVYVGGMFFDRKVIC